jgi:hypothetical protein
MMAATLRDLVLFDRCLRLLPRPHRTVTYERCRDIRSWSSSKVLVPQVAVAVKFFKIINRSFKCYTGKAGTTRKSMILNAGNAVPYGYAGKAGTIVKSALDTGNAVWYGYAG